MARAGSTEPPGESRSMIGWDGFSRSSAARTTATESGTMRPRSAIQRGSSEVTVIGVRVSAAVKARAESLQRTKSVVRATSPLGAILIMVRT